MRGEERSLTAYRDDKLRGVRDESLLSERVDSLSLSKAQVKRGQRIDSRKRSASTAALHPVPTAVTAWR